MEMQVNSELSCGLAEGEPQAITTKRIGYKYEVYSCGEHNLSTRSPFLKLCKKGINLFWPCFDLFIWISLWNKDGISFGNLYYGLHKYGKTEMQVTPFMNELLYDQTFER